MVQLPNSHVDLLDRPVVVMLATVMPDGQPQVTPVWCNRQNDLVWVNTAVGRQKDVNLRERPFATIAVMDPENPYRWMEVRGEVVGRITGQPAHDHINQLAQAYFGRPFTYNSAGEERVIYQIAPRQVNWGG